MADGVYLSVAEVGLADVESLQGYDLQRLFGFLKVMLVSGVSSVRLMLGGEC